MTSLPDKPAWQQPRHPNLIQVHTVPGTYSSYATSPVSLPAGALFSSITNHFFFGHRTWPSAESPCGRHIDLNSDLFYANHSCQPSLESDLNRMEVRVSRFQGLYEGDVLSFFYPSTEWSMVQPFECFCKKSKCFGRIMGASQMGKTKLKGYWLNQHIEERLKRIESKNDRASLQGKAASVFIHR